MGLAGGSKLKFGLGSQSQHTTRLQGALFTLSAVVPGSAGPALVASPLLGAEQTEGTGKETSIK